MGNKRSESQSLGLQHPTSVFTQCPDREYVSVSRVCDHTILIEHSHDFLPLDKPSHQTFILAQPSPQSHMFENDIPVEENPHPQFENLSNTSLLGAMALGLSWPEIDTIHMSISSP